MCGKVTLLTWDELLAVARELGAAKASAGAVADWPATARPGSTVPVLAPAGGDLELAALPWGLPAPWNGRLVYNARVENAGGRLWADAFAHGRVLVPVAGFFEPRTAGAPGGRARGQADFRDPAGGALLLGAVREQGRVVVVTTEPNAQVASVHHRMPLVVSRHEAPAWLGAGWRELADRSSFPLAVQEAPRTPADPAQLSLF